jgi:hypothetical protein
MREVYYDVSDAASYFVIPAWPESFFMILNKSEGFPTSGNDNTTNIQPS